MCKKSVIEREKKKILLNNKYQTQRQHLKSIIINQTLTSQQRWEAYIKLQSLPRNSSFTRLRNRCFLTGRARGVFRKFGLCRIKLRELAVKGEVPGLKKASW